MGYTTRVYLKRNIGAKDTLTVRHALLISESEALAKDKCGLLEKVKVKAWAPEPRPCFQNFPFTLNRNPCSHYTATSHFSSSLSLAEAILHPVSMDLLVPGISKVLSLSVCLLSLTSSFLPVVGCIRTLLCSQASDSLLRACAPFCPCICSGVGVGGSILAERNGANMNIDMHQYLWAC